jgi:hypothetical protein
MESTIKYQPSTSTKSKSFRGKESIMGGNIIIPMERRTLETTMSMTKNGI